MEYLLAVIGILFGWMMIEKSKKEKAQSQLEQAKYRKDDAVIAAEQQVLKDNNQKEIEQLEQEKQQQLNLEELAKYFKDKK